MRPAGAIPCVLGVILAGTLVAGAMIFNAEEAAASPRAAAQDGPPAPMWPGPLGAERIATMTQEEAWRALEVVDAAREYVHRSIEYLEWQDQQLDVQQRGLTDRLREIRPDDAGAPRRDARSDAIPRPLSEAQINAMTKDEIREALTAVSKARVLFRDDPKIQERLRREFDLLLARLKRVP